jgi:transcriptional regulator with XRE-family HTH domain
MRHRLEKPLLRAARALLGYSQQYVSEKTNVSAGTIAHLESDQRQVKLETELKVRDFYQDQGIEFVIAPDKIGLFLPIHKQMVSDHLPDEESSA